jgi:hypothetical protein
MRFPKILGVVAAGLFVVGCQTTTSTWTPPQDNTQTIINLIGSGLSGVEVLLPAAQTYQAPDGRDCGVYRIRQHISGSIRAGVATVCHYPGQRWVLVSRNIEPPVATTQPPATTSPGGWRPVTY